jgi:hypothetical protein
MRPYIKANIWRDSFTPIDSIEADGDILMVFLSPNGVVFSQATDDEWYRANVSGGYVALPDSPDAQVYWLDEAASPMGCVKQWQWCNLGLPQDHRCGPLASYYDAVYGAASLFNLTSKDLEPERPLTSEELSTRLIWPALITYQYLLLLEIFFQT